MSAFGNYEKDNIVDAIEILAKSEYNEGKSPRQIIESIMEAVTYGITSALFDLRDEKVDRNA